MHCLHFSFVADGDKNTHGSWVIIEHVLKPLSTNFLFPQAAGEDMLNTCWRDSDFCSNGHAWNTAHTVKDGLRLFHVAFICHHCWAPLRGALSVSSRPFLMAFIHQRTAYVKEHVSLNLCSVICNTLEHFYPTKHEILLMFSCPSARNFSVVFPDPQLNSNWDHNDSARLW
jgi:hypothetical protein